MDVFVNVFFFFDKLFFVSNLFTQPFDTDPSTGETSPSRVGGVSVIRSLREQAREKGIEMGLVEANRIRWDLQESSLVIVEVIKKTTFEFNILP